MSSMRGQDIPAPWSAVSQQWGHPWHSMCSYLGAFPPALARALITVFSDKDGTVLDPFSGRGTTLLEARLLGREALATDLNPIAYTLSSAKATNIRQDDVKQRVRELEDAFDPVLYRPEARAQDSDIRLIYHNDTLAELCYLRRHLVDSKRPEDRFLVGVLLGVMHGSPRKDGSSAYASISMPNTFSMSPNYVRNYVRQNGLERVYRDVFDLLVSRVDWLCREGSDFSAPGKAALCDAKDLTSCPLVASHSEEVDLVVTSPPYLNVVNYAKQNWIRTWLLSEEYERDDFELDDNLKFNDWVSLILDFLEEARKLLSPSGIVALVVADVVKDDNSVVPLSREILRRVKWSELFEYAGCLSDYFETKDKTTRIWRDTKGRASKVERVIILSDETPTIRLDGLRDVLPEVPSEVMDELTPEVLEAHADYLAAV